VGARCGKSARRVLSGGRPERAVPTGTSALQAAQVHGYITTLEPPFEAQCRRILGTLVKLALPAKLRGVEGDTRIPGFTARRSSLAAGGRAVQTIADEIPV
jgi:hypothetical protein